MGTAHTKVYDVVILGAGVAGLSAAQHLHRAGKQVLVLEARDRLGGRIYTRHDLAPVPVELGAELVHGTQAATWPLLRSAGIATHELVVTRSSDLSEGPELWQLDFAHLPRPKAHENVGQYLDRVNLDGNRMPAYLQFLDADGEPLRRMNARFFFAYYAHLPGKGEHYGDRDFRVPGGYDQLVQLLARGVPVRRQAVVQEIYWGHGHATVLYLHNHRVQSVQARSALVTIPIGTLRHGDVRFAPALPLRKITAIQSFSTVDVAKLIYIFDHKIFPEDVDQLRDFNSNPPMWWRGSAGHPHAHGDIAIGWTAGDNARLLLEQDYETALHTGLDSLRQLLGDSTLTPRRGLLHNWGGDPYTRGAYSFALTGSDDAVEALAAPLARTLFWAGEATSLANSATVHGAYESGLRAAQEILDQASR